MKKLFTLFFKMLYISAFTFGGGFVIVSFMRKTFVEQLGWISDEEMLDLTAVAQSSPGAVAVNAAVAVGWHVAKLPGIIVAVLGTVTPPIVILSVISLFYNAFASNAYIANFIAGMRCCVVAVIFDAALKLIDTKSWTFLVLLFIAFILYFFFRVEIVVLILCAVVLGAVRSLHHAS